MTRYEAVKLYLRESFWADTYFVWITLAIAAVVWMLAGCQSAPKKPEPLATANIPIVAACIDDQSIDALPATSMPPRTAGPDALAAGAAADLLRYRELARRQQEMLRACARVK